MKKILLSLCMALLLVGCYHAFNSPKIDITKIDIKKYIDVADEMSKGVGQVNWKYILAVDLVQNKGKSNKEELLQLKENFITDKKINNLDQILKNFHFDESEQKDLANYFEDSSTWGIIPERLVDGTKYTQFITDIREGSISNYEKHGILPSITIAQAILESSWGESDLTKEGNNLFGIKSSPKWQGAQMNFNTKEFNDTYVKANFRKYDNKAESILDHGKFLSENPRYNKQGLFEGKTYLEQAKSLELAGYSTAQNEAGEKIYSDMLAQLIRQYNLQLIDFEVQSNS